MKNGKVSRGLALIVASWLALSVPPPLEARQRESNDRPGNRSLVATEPAQPEVRAVEAPPVRLVPRVAADACPSTTREFSLLPFGPAADTTVGQADDYNLPTDTLAPTCTAPTNCTGSGPPASLPRGAIFNGTGAGPDRAFRINTNVGCTLSITATPTGTLDLALIVYQGTCSNNLSDCVCVDDTGAEGQAETVSLAANPGTDYFIVVDGYGLLPGPSGPFELSISETTSTGCRLGTALDVDGNGAFTALTDGLILLRFAFGFRGGTLIADAVGAGCTRCTAPEIEAYIVSQ
jgi:hypothetical protein